MDFEIGAMIGWNENDLDNSHKDDCLQHNGKGVGNHFRTPLVGYDSAEKKNDRVHTTMGAPKNSGA